MLLYSEMMRCLKVNMSYIYIMTYTIEVTPLQYLSHILLNRGWPPMSHSYIRIHTYTERGKDIIIGEVVVGVRKVKEAWDVATIIICMRYQWHSIKEGKQLVSGFCFHYHTQLTFIVTFPLVTFLMLKPTVGIMSSLNCPL